MSPAVWIIAKTAIAAVVISFASWLAGKKPILAGFILALPLATLLALVFQYSEYRDADKAVAFAKSIFVAVPLSLLFFVPFLLAEKLRWDFWQLYGAGIALLIFAYGIHRLVARLLV